MKRARCPDSPDNNPKIRILPASKGKQIVAAHKREAQKKAQSKNMFILLIIFLVKQCTLN